MGEPIRTVNIHEAKTHLSRLIESAMHGTETIIAKAGKPVAKIVPIAPPKPIRIPGILKGKIKTSSDFDAPLSDEILDSFEGLER
jgi:prevent-host-death family protein